MAERNARSTMREYRAAVDRITPWIPKAECICERCGRDYPIWYADNEAWNLAVNRTQEYGDEWQYLCPTCFVHLHEIATGEVHIWSLAVST